MIIVAFDLGQHFAWATNWRLARPRWGHVDFAEFRAHRLGECMKWLRSRTSLIRRVDVVVYETPVGVSHAARLALFGMAGVIEACASEASKPVIGIANNTVKKFAARSGRAPKEAMIGAARKLGYRGSDDNEADAWCLLKYAEANLERVPTTK
jgi:hypothetical protein